MSQTTPLPPKGLRDLFTTSPEGIWQPNTNHLLKHMIRLQATAGRRNLDALHYWRYKPEHSNISEVYREPLERVYHDPVTLFAYVQHGVLTKKLTKTGVEYDFDHEIRIDLAEAIRLGELFKETTAGLEYYFALPRSNDLYQWDSTLYEIGDTKPNQYYRLVKRYVTWTTTANIFRDDSTNLKKPLPENPKVEHPVWLQ